MSLTDNERTIIVRREMEKAQKTYQCLFCYMVTWRYQI